MPEPGRTPQAPRTPNRPRPYVVVHVAVSLDGASTGFEVDLGGFYALARTWKEDVTLTGADTILAQERELAALELPGPTPAGPLLAVVDSRYRVRQWEALRDCGYWSGVVALRGATASTEGPTLPVPEFFTGSERVDLGAALTFLAERHSAALVRVDSGGELTGALLRQGLVDELSLLVHPVLAGVAGVRSWHGSLPAPALPLRRLPAEPQGDGLVWLRYRVSDRPDVGGVSAGTGPDGAGPDVSAAPAA